MRNLGRRRACPRLLVYLRAYAVNRGDFEAAVRSSRQFPPPLADFFVQETKLGKVRVAGHIIEDQRAVF